MAMTLTKDYAQRGDSVVHNDNPERAGVVVNIRHVARGLSGRTERRAIVRWNDGRTSEVALKWLTVPGREPAPVAASTNPDGECQVCGRTQKLLRGRLAHHGYRRPWEGYQTASCRGARHLPFPAYDALEQYAATVQAQRDDLQARIEDLRAGVVAQIPVQRRTNSTWQRRAQYETTMVTPDTDAGTFARLGIQNGWQQVVRGAVAQAEATLRHVEHERERVTARLAKAKELSREVR